MTHESCVGCRHYLGGGACKQNLEAECAAGYFEGWEALVPYTEAVEVCPYCGTENTFPNWDAEKQGYIAVCANCGKKIFLCDECSHADDNAERKCDWHEEDGFSGMCMRGIIFGDGTGSYAKINSDCGQAIKWEDIYE